MVSSRDAKEPSSSASSAASSREKKIKKKTKKISKKMRVDARNDEEEEKKEKKKKKTVSSGKSAKKAKSDDDATMRFLLKLFSDSTNITAGDDENDALSSAKLEGETRSAIFGEGGFAKASLLRFDDDDGSEIPLREEKIRFVRASGKRKKSW